MELRMYEVYDGGALIGTATAARAAEMTGMLPRNIYGAASTGCMLRRRYRIVPTAEGARQGVIPQALCEEWDAARLRILKGAGKDKPAGP